MYRSINLLQQDRLCVLFEQDVLSSPTVGTLFNNIIRIIIQVIVISLVNMIDNQSIKSEIVGNTAARTGKRARSLVLVDEIKLDENFFMKRTSKHSVQRRRQAAQQIEPSGETIKYLDTTERVISGAQVLL